MNPFANLSATLARLATLDARGDETAARARYLKATRSCDHPKYRLTYGASVGGVMQYRSQCEACGDRSKPIPGRELSATLRSQAGPPDEELHGKWCEQFRCILRFAQQARDEASAIRQQPGFYALYIASPEWAAKRLEVLRRARDWCEWCRARPAEEVHHKTYARLGTERLEDLMALCPPCHEAVHADKTRLAQATEG